MNPPEEAQRSLPRYDIREDEMTRPCVVLFDWNGDDEQTVRVSGLRASVAEPVRRADLEDELDDNPFGPRWQGIGRRPGTLALAVVLGLSVAIGIVALLTPADGSANQAQATSLSLR